MMIIKMWLHKKDAIVECMHIGKVGHTTETCYKKHGYPPNFGRGNEGVGSYANFAGTVFKRT
jgi:hypothetical protein